MNRLLGRQLSGFWQALQNAFATTRPWLMGLVVLYMSACPSLPWMRAGIASERGASALDTAALNGGPSAAFSGALSAAFSGALSEAHRYTETTGQVRQRIQWRLERAQDYILTSTTADEVSVCRIDSSFNTHRWEIQRLDRDTHLTARRVAREIHVSGTLEGAAIERTFEIDDDPWYQAGSLSLRAFAQSNQEKIRFWILRPGKFTAHKLEATRMGVASLEVNGEPVNAHKIKVCLTGWKATFWSATYWFRAEDGVFLRYQGASGPPGSPETVVEWTPSSDG
jgi:hypothetical protein